MGVAGRAIAGSLRWSLVLLVIAAHAAAALLALRSGLRAEHPGGLFLLALPLAQAGLVPIAAAFSRFPAWLALPPALAALGGAWLFALVVVEAPYNSSAALGWGLLLAAEMLLVFTAAAAGRLLWFQLSWVETAETRAAKLPRWSLLASCLSVLLAAALLGAGRWLLPQLGFSEGALRWRELLAYPLAGALHALYALLMLAALAPRWWIVRGALTVVAGLAVIVCAGYAPGAETAIFGRARFDELASINLAASQAAIVWLSLLVLRIAPQDAARPEN